MLHLYDYLPSGNGYKVRLLLHQLEIPFALTTLDIWGGASRTPEFLAKNPNGRIPTLQLEDGSHLWESHAILWYLAEGTAFLPTDRLARAQVLQWLCFEQYEVEPAIGVLRARLNYTAKDPSTWQELYDSCRQRGLKSLNLLNEHLARQPFMVNGSYSLADIAIYGYVHVAEESHFDMGPYSHILAWQEKVRSQPRHIPITWRP